MPRFLISGLPWMCVLGKRPPLTKNTFIPSKAIATKSNISVKTSIFMSFLSKMRANLKKVSDKLLII